MDEKFTDLKLDTEQMKYCLGMIAQQERCFEQIDITLQYLFRVSSLFISDHTEEAMYHLGRLTSELKAFSEYNNPEKEEDLK